MGNSTQGEQSSLENWKWGLKRFYGPNSHHPALLGIQLLPLLKYKVNLAAKCTRKQLVTYTIASYLVYLVHVLYSQ